MVHVKMPRPEPESVEETLKRLAHMTREEKIALASQLVAEVQGHKLMMQAMAVPQEGRPR